jgi:hypothetical protein
LRAGATYSSDEPRVSKELVGAAGFEPATSRV